MTFKEKIKKIIQDSHDCAEWGCWEDHEDSINSIIALVLSELPEERVLNKDNPQYVLGWNAYKAILKERLGE